MWNVTGVSLVFILMLFLVNFFWIHRLLNCHRFIPNTTKGKSPDINYTTTAAPLKPHSKYVDRAYYSPLANDNNNTSHSSPIAFSNININIGRWDNQRLYKMIDFALIGEMFDEASRKSLVCLASQSSIERLHSLVQVAHQWNGPISVAVFVAGSEEFRILQYYVTYLRICFNRIRNNVVFHIAYPFDNVPDDDNAKTIKFSYESLNCQYPERTLRLLLKSRSQSTIRWRLKNVYPQNHMRNLARKGCQSKYVFLTDIDIIPSRNIAEELNKFLETHKCVGKKCAFVIPTYEIDLRVSFPSSKKELLLLAKKGLARPFHEKVFIYNQYATNFSRWQANKHPETDIYISHNVTNFEFLYEPFYVADDIVPVHDERFLGYGFTRNSQVYEMYVAGYEFFVLSPVFTCHWGLQHKKTRPSWREQQNNINRKRFELFKKEIFAKYQKNSINLGDQSKSSKMHQRSIGSR